MKKNVASQVIDAQMCSATDGSDFTGTVTVSVKGDGGTLTAGGGTVTHKGSGLHQYQPTQAETNYDHVSFQFKGTGALTAAVQAFPTFPQTGDSFGLIGATGSGLTSLATQASVNIIDDFLDTEIAAIKAKTDSLTFTDAGKVDATLQTAADLKAVVANRVADHIIRRSLTTALASADGDAKGFRSLGGAVAKLVNKVAISGANLVTYEPDDLTTLGTQAITTDAAAEPITSVDTA
ncbi:hypothetical protein [Nitrosovibrio sp. Nv4]|uniref:hypothetical protein n=1 Tax=Nitrosovibrio sp. Nv4 TaxID=1945880 RepID=UPI000BCD5FD4|nr:hypothetical protein [Nitrosovibrio sp. Nv4]SOD41317.1 hypothetical protein SAMN06298226_1612 [Nitrosovibrio sp. Nv4]